MTHCCPTKLKIKCLLPPGEGQDEGVDNEMFVNSMHSMSPHPDPLLEGEGIMFFAIFISPRANISKDMDINVFPLLGEVNGTAMIVTQTLIRTFSRTNSRPPSPGLSDFTFKLLLDLLPEQIVTQWRACLPRRVNLVQFPAVINVDFKQSLVRFATC